MKFILLLICGMLPGLLLFSFGGFAQKNTIPDKEGKFEIIEIDSTTLDHYYWITLKRKCLLFSSSKKFTLLSMKNSDSEQKKRKTKLMVGQTHFFDLYMTLNVLIDTREGAEPDSIYYNPLLVGPVVKIKGKTLFSDKKAPYLSPCVVGLYYLHGKEEDCD